MSNNNQFRIHPLTAAVTAALGTGTAATALAQEGGDDALEEVIVTATKVEQNLQDIKNSKFFKDNYLRADHNELLLPSKTEGPILT